MKYTFKIIVLFLFCFSGLLTSHAQQTRQVTGSVLGPDKQPLPNANVSVKGSKQGDRSS